MVAGVLVIIALARVLKLPQRGVVYNQASLELDAASAGPLLLAALVFCALFFLLTKVSDFGGVFGCGPTNGQ